MSGYDKPPGAPTFWQVIPDNGYILHAVRATFADGGTRERYGLYRNLTRGPTACRKVKGRDAQGFASLRLQFTEEETARVRSQFADADLIDRFDQLVPKEFTRKWEDFDALQLGQERRICGECATEVMRAWEAHRYDGNGLG